MQRFTDIHCHILPGLDDGARSRDMMARMLALAYKSGTKSIIATSHYNPSYYHYTRLDYQQRLALAQILARDIDPDFRIYSGNELYFFVDHTVEALRDGSALTLAGSKYVLVEFAPFQNFEFIKNAMNHLLMHGYWPILAHAERYECLVHGGPKKVDELCRLGIYIQVNVMHLHGGFGSGKVKEFIHKLIKNNIVHFIASDAHNTDFRTPDLGKGALYLMKKYGKDVCHRLFCENAQYILKNKPL